MINKFMIPENHAPFAETRDALSLGLAARTTLIATFNAAEEGAANRSKRNLVRVFLILAAR